MLSYSSTYIFDWFNNFWLAAPPIKEKKNISKWFSVQMISMSAMAGTWIGEGRKNFRDKLHIYLEPWVSRRMFSYTKAKLLSYVNSKYLKNHISTTLSGHAETVKTEWSWQFFYESVCWTMSARHLIFTHDIRQCCCQLKMSAWSISCKLQLDYKYKVECVG